MTKMKLTSVALSGALLIGGVGGMASAQSGPWTTGLSEAEVIEIALTEVPGQVCLTSATGTAASSFGGTATARSIAARGIGG